MHIDIMEIPKNKNNKDSKNISGPVFILMKMGFEYEIYIRVKILFGKE